jgi:hypothetical protein
VFGASDRQTTHASSVRRFVTLLLGLNWRENTGDTLTEVLADVSNTDTEVTELLCALRDVLRLLLALFKRLVPCGGKHET